VFQTFVDQYKELETDVDIAHFLDQHGFLHRWDPKSSLTQTLAGNNLGVCCEFVTQRTKYKLGDVTIDLDESSFGYNVGELELMVADDPREIKQAEAKLLHFARQHGLYINTGMRGKVLEYLRLFRQGHYQALVNCGLVASKGVMNSN